MEQGRYNCPRKISSAREVSCSGRRLIGGTRAPDGQESREAEEQECADGDRAAVGSEGSKVQRGSTQGRAGEISQTDCRFVDAAVFALFFAAIHGIKQGRIID